MSEIHCHSCGGFVENGKRYVSYRLPERLVERAEATGSACRCIVPVVYGPPPGHRSMAINVANLKLK